MNVDSGRRRRHYFDKPTHFAKAGDGKWTCKVCPPDGDGQLPEIMLFRTARRHEQSAAHKKSVSAPGSRKGPSANSEPRDNPVVIAEESSPLTEKEIKSRERDLHVELLDRLVPFWIDSVRAAEDGAVPKLEQFLNELQSTWNEWYHSSPAEPQATWGDEYGDAQNGWGPNVHWEDPWVRKSAQASSQTSQCRTLLSERDLTGPPEASKTPLSQEPPDHDYRAFVEDFALQHSANAERKKWMYDFYEMPTSAKLDKIKEMIRVLHKLPSS